LGGANGDSQLDSVTVSTGRLRRTTSPSMPERVSSPWTGLAWKTRVRSAEVTDITYDSSSGKPFF
jgi:hypothetical protein